MAYGKLLISCPLNWLTADDAGVNTVRGAVDSCFFPLYEIERHITTITYDPEPLGRRISMSEWLGSMGKTKHLCRPEFAGDLTQIEGEIERRWERLKAMDANPLL